MEIEAEFFCAYCGEPNATLVDPSSGMEQEYVEDCQVCCRPNRLVIRLGAGAESAEIEAFPENP